MQVQRALTSLIQTKLNRPLLPVDLVPRSRLTDWLEQRRRRPLTLVSAPAGYGKSTLISCWLESADCPFTWISLDERDNEIESFLSYFLAAIQKIFPGTMQETQDLLMVTSLPPVPVIAHNLINELNRVTEPFILVLDDYHLIETQSIHGLIEELLLHPPRCLHLVLITRMDPPLPLITMRAKGSMTEVRVPSLRFDQEESRLLMEMMIRAPIEQANLIEIESKAEGWVTGLCLAALAVRHRVGQENLRGEISVDNRYLNDYLLSEILAKHAATTSDCMLKTSILERFCDDLCNAICFQGSEHSGNGSEGSELGGKKFLDWLQASNLFIIPLDDRREWFRYHHLFREFLNQELTQRLNQAEIAELHATAGHWHAQNGSTDEALSHLLKAGEIASAIELVAEHRYGMMNTTQWPRLERLLNLFSAQIIETSAELWMVKIWLVYQRAQYSEIPAMLEHLDAILAGEPDDEAANRLAGEIYSLRSAIAYYSGDSETTISTARVALELLDPNLWIVRVMVRMYLGGALLLSGDENGGYHAFYGAFEEEKVQNLRFKATLLMTACYFHWITADLSGMAQAAKQSIALCHESGHRQILGQANYHLGCVRYQQGDLALAEEHFVQVVGRPYHNYGVAYINSVCGLALTYQAQGREKEARGVIEEGIAFLLETGNTTLLTVLQALQAEIAQRQENLAAASKWAEKLDPTPPLVPMPWFLAPHLTLVKVWLAQKTPASRGKAKELLLQLQEYLVSIHNTRFLIETLALQALLHDDNGDQPAALASLERALRLAQPGGFIRLFVDLGPSMAVLITQLRMDKELGVYINQIQSAYPGSLQIGAAKSQDEFLEPLTNRELEILELLGERLTNKEIAAQLIISPGTVKGHTIRIYDKLDVKGRRQAVEKAIALGILIKK